MRRGVGALVVTLALILGAAAPGTAQPAGASAPSGTVASSAVASAAAALATPMKVNKKYLVCDPKKWPGANPTYPYSFVLSTKYRHTRSARIKASVRSVQRVINDRIWGNQLNPKKRVQIAVDGIYGPQTRAAVKKFQKATGLTVTGRVGPRTWRMLAAYCGSD